MYNANLCIQLNFVKLMHLGDYETALSISLSINVDTNTRTGCMIEILRALLRGDTYGLIGIWEEVVVS